MKHPQAGGRYVRNKDGSLTRADADDKDPKDSKPSPAAPAAKAEPPAKGAGNLKDKHDA